MGEQQVKEYEEGPDVPRRSLGAHLARMELIMVVEEWLRRIPDFALAGDAPLVERGGQLMLHTVPLRCDVPS